MVTGTPELCESSPAFDGLGQADCASGRKNRTSDLPGVLSATSAFFISLEETMKHHAIRLTACLAGALLGFSAPTAHAGAVTETVHLVVTGGPNAGTWDVSSDRGGCSAGLTGPGSWGNQLSQPKEKDRTRFNSLQLIVPDAKKAAAGGKEFMILFRFGPLIARNTEYVIETRPAEARKKGSGTVAIADKGGTAKVSFNVISAEGYKFVGTIECKSVMRGG